jgi:hypothetical protein
MISKNTVTEQLGVGDNDSTTSEEDNTEVPVDAEQTSMSSGVKLEKKKSKKSVFNREWLKIVEYEQFCKRI